MVALFAGLMMIIMGLNMMNIFPWLKKFNPRIPKFIQDKVDVRGKGPFVVGLANGFMPCGHLQSMQLFALSTGSFTRGALSMMFFSLGTVPLMFGLGLASSMLSKRFTKNMMLISGVLVLLLGAGMFNTGLNLSGVAVAAPPKKTAEGQVEIRDGVQYIKSNMDRRSYEPITVQVGIPVEWNHYVEEGDLTSCNNAIIINKLGIEEYLGTGDNIFKFTPDKVGTIQWSCWMGMIGSQIHVVESLDTQTDQKTDNEVQGGNTPPTDNDVQNIYKPPGG